MLNVSTTERREEGGVEEGMGERGGEQAHIFFQEAAYAAVRWMGKPTTSASNLDFTTYLYMHVLHLSVPQYPQPVERYIMPLDKLLAG